MPISPSKHSRRSPRLHDFWIRDCREMDIIPYLTILNVNALLLEVQDHHFSSPTHLLPKNGIQTALSTHYSPPNSQAKNQKNLRTKTQNTKSPLMNSLHYLLNHLIPPEIHKPLIPTPCTDLPRH